MQLKGYNFQFFHISVLLNCQTVALHLKLGFHCPKLYCNHKIYDLYQYAHSEMSKLTSHDDTELYIHTKMK